MLITIFLSFIRRQQSFVRIITSGSVVVFIFVTQIVKQRARHDASCKKVCLLAVVIGASRCCKLKKKVSCEQKKRLALMIPLSTNNWRIWFFFDFENTSLTSLKSKFWEFLIYFYSSKVRLFVT